MRDITKAQLTIGLLALFTTMWELAFGSRDLLVALEMVAVQAVVLLVLSYTLIALLEWVGVFDLRTNSVLTLVVLVTFRILTTASFNLP
jgi:hypothetical protein